MGKAVDGTRAEPGQLTGGFPQWSSLRESLLGIAGTLLGHMPLGDLLRRRRDGTQTCGACGTKLVAEAAFCHSCGARADDPDSQPLHVVDRITGLFNDRFLRPILEDELARAHLYGRSLGVLLLEPAETGPMLVPPEGEEMLRLMASAVAGTLRDVDTPGVLSRDPPSILALLPDTDASGTAHAASHVLEAVTAALAQHGRQAALGIVCIQPTQRLRASEVIDAATRSLRSGRPEFVGR
jgi:GGDEF domain-containing protein